MVKMTAKWFGFKLVGECAAASDNPWTASRNAVHTGCMDAVEVDGVGVLTGIDEVNSEKFPFDAAQGWTGTLTNYFAISDGCG